MFLNYKKKIVFLIIISTSIISILFGFFLNEDLSTGGSSWDFNLTWPIVQEYTNFNFDSNKSQITRHVPLHYFILSFFNLFIEEKNSVRFIYFIFSSLLPYFLYLNLNQLYKDKKLNILIVCFSFFLLPFFRSSAMWANAHLTAVIFFLIANFFYLKSKKNNQFFFKLLNLFFLSLATYSLQSYVILYVFYLYRYFKSENLKTFLNLFFFSCILGAPGLYFIIHINPRAANLPFTEDIFFNLCFNFTLIFFYLLFVLSNKENIKLFYNGLHQIKVIHIFLLILIFFVIVFNLNFELLNSSLKGGGFFYKVSHFIFKNNSFFIFVFFLSLFTIFNFIKISKNLIELIVIVNLMSINVAIYQKYFELSFLIFLFVLNENYIVKNVISNIKNSLSFYLVAIFYLLISYINYFYEFSYKLVI